jgi:hypothetical protein
MFYIKRMQRGRPRPGIYLGFNEIDSKIRKCDPLSPADNFFAHYIQSHFHCRSHLIHTLAQNIQERRFKLARIYLYK